MTVNHRQALELARQGDWDAAHACVQHASDTFSCEIHACLHRIEGDMDNADYWYRRAGIRRPLSAPRDELAALYDRLGAADN